MPGILVFPGLVPRPAESSARFADAVVGRMDRRLAHVVGAVADIHAPALETVGKSIRHGIAKGAQLVFQLLLHPASLVLFHCIVFTIVHPIFLTLLPVHTG